MTIKLGSLSRWALFPQGALTLAGREEGERRIRIQFNCETETALYRVVEGVEDQQLVVVGLGQPDRGRIEGRSKRGERLGDKVIVGHTAQGLAAARTRV